jgi:dephospho-CoA kinase
MPRTIGLTGNIATGKSTVAAILGELGARVVDADKVAHQVMAPPGPVFDAIVRAFGSEVVAPNGSIDRRKLGAIVFSDPAALRQLDAIVHPETSKAIRQLIATAPDAFLVVEAVKLIESGTYQACDAVWVCTCPPDQQIERLVTTRRLDYPEAERRVRAQSPVAAKLPYATEVIDTSGSLADTRWRVIAAWNRFTDSSGARSTPSDSSP